MNLKIWLIHKMKIREKLMNTSVKTITFLLGSLLGQAFIAQTVMASKCDDLIKKEDFYGAAEVCEKLAKKNDRNAQFYIATLYFDGKGVMEDNAQAINWFRKAAERNHSQAQYNLAIMLASGLGTEADLVEAYAWLKISQKRGYAPATEVINKMGPELSSSEKKQADKKIAELKKQFKL